MHVEPATPSDAPVMADIKMRAVRKHASDHYNREQLAVIAPTDPDDEGYLSLLAQDPFEAVVATEGEPVGFGIIHVDDGQIHAIFVRPDRMNEGIGTELLTELEQRAIAAETTDLWVLSTLNAVSFYECNGYERVQRETLGDDPEVPVVRMETQL
jgi:ribosomal protein S18 acetylase RimI-like enzyme